MIQPENIRPLTDFKRNTAKFRRSLRRTGLPTVLTVEGRAELVVQDAAAYQRLLEAVERLAAIEGVDAGLRSMRKERGVPADEFFTSLRRGLSRRGKKSA